MSMRTGRLFTIPLAAGSWAAGVAAATDTIYPAAGINATGYTDYVSKHSGEVLVYGGDAAGSPRMETGYPIGRHGSCRGGEGRRGGAL
jgi:hypothetical protein